MRNRQEVDLSRRRVLDGGFATELERRGVSIAGPLWSARALAEAPEAVLAVHRSYLEAGADILLTGSYQASALGFHKAGLAPEESSLAANAALRRSVALALEARGDRADVLIAVSLGPYGAALANGAEFHGEYGFRDPREEWDALLSFHRDRIAAVVDTEADLLAFETVPSLREAEAIVAALAEWPHVGAWISFTCRNAEETAHGERLLTCAAVPERSDQALAVGVNCTAPVFVEGALSALREATAKPLIVYPNSGEQWDGEHRCWLGSAEASELGTLAYRWYGAGASIVGGCCRTTPAHVRQIRSVLDAEPR